MKIIYVSSELFQQMKNSNDSWKTLVENYNGDWHEINLRGGLDHIFETKKQFTFSDIGCNGLDNSFIVRSRKKVKELQ